MNSVDPDEQWERELEKDPIIQLYRQAFTLDEVPPALDKKVLAAYRRKFKPSFWRRWLFLIRQDGQASFNWPLAPALAIGLLVGFILPEYTNVELPSKSIEQIGASVRGGKSPADQKTQTDDPQEWLTTIANLVYEGKFTEAEHELAAFKQRYPEYEHKVTKKLNNND